MNSIKNYLMSFVVGLILIQLCLIIYGGFTDSYGLARDAGQEVNMFEKIVQMNIVAGPIRLANSVVNLFTVSFNPIDLVGSLLSAGIGCLQTIGGIITLPAEIIGIIGDFYYIPGVVAVFVGTSVLITMAILLIQLYIKPFQPM
jgi:hypothetical protein